MSLFVEMTTDKHSFRYKLPGGGRLQRRGGQAQSGSRKAAGKWDVAFPLEDFGDQIAANDIALAYMTAAEYQRHLDSVQNANTNTVRFELLKALLNNTERSFNDETLNTPTLLVEPLANADAVVYPPVLGSESEATDDHYLESGYAYTAISNTNDPFPVIVNELEEHFGVQTGGSEILVLVNQAETPYIADLAAFDPVVNRYINPGADVNSPNAGALGILPPGMTAKILGVHADSGAVIAEWRWLPAHYMLAVHLDAPRPLIKRVDPAATGLGQGLQLVARDASYPFESAHWRHRFGFGCGNRLNGVVMELGSGGTYSIPSGYS